MLQDYFCFMAALPALSKFFEIDNSVYGLALQIQTQSIIRVYWRQIHIEQQNVRHYYRLNTKLFCTKQK